MRKRIKRQLSFEQVPIDEVALDLSCRHELVSILSGLQRLYHHPETMRQILALIEADVLGGRSKRRGARGMDCWEVLVLAAVRHGCGLDYDALHDLANNHRALRQMMGRGGWDNDKPLARATIHENLTRVRTETIERISALVVAEGHRLRPEAIETVRGDGFVTETNIHAPTDSALIVDGLRVMVREAVRLSEGLGLGGWRQHDHLLKQARKLDRRIGKAKGKNRDQVRQDAYRELLARAEAICQRVAATAREAQGALDGRDLLDRILGEEQIKTLREFSDLTRRVCDQARRRVLQGECVPNDEKLLSLFEQHTQLIKRGKQSKPFELGRRVVVVEDGEGFIVHARVLERGELEQDVLTPIMEELQKRFDNRIRSASWDRGFYTPANLDALRELVEVACLPRKGYRRQEDVAFEDEEEFQSARRRHPGIESAIHGLMDGGGLERCPDRGEEGFKRYVALGVLGRNLQTLGRLSHAELLEQSKRKAA